MNRPLALSAAIAAALLAGGCRTTNAGDWAGGATTPFKQAERSCQDLTRTVEEPADRRDFFIACMGTLGWAPRPGAVIEL